MTTFKRYKIYHSLALCFLTTLFTCAAQAGQGKWVPQDPYSLEKGHCYRGEGLYYNVVQKLDAHHYVMVSNMVLPRYQMAILVLKRGEINSQEMIGNAMKIVGETEVKMQNGFSQTAFVFNLCDPSQE